MSFGFQFDEDELDDEYRNVISSHEESQKISILPGHPSAGTTGVKAKKHCLSDLLSTLPPRISYSSLNIPLKQSEAILYRRDLFDARFQLINDADNNLEEEEEEEELGIDQSGMECKVKGQDKSEGFSAGANTDLIPRVYEGGFKTWECAIDLVQYLEVKLTSEGEISLLKDCSVIELGCGTALPSLYLFSRMLSSDEKQIRSTLNLCDYNEQVLHLVSLFLILIVKATIHSCLPRTQVTLPNLFLTWYFSTKRNLKEEIHGELELTSELVEEFKSSMKSREITLNFYSGSWETLHEVGTFDHGGKDINIVLTSETIYSMDSLPALVDALGLACSGSIESSLQQTTLTDEEDSKGKVKDLCLVAAKVLYFGVGGGVNALEAELSQRQATSKTVWKSDRGVARVVLQIHF